MDLETENRIAAILLKEAAELRRQAEKEGALAYLRQPQTRFRPNSRFLTATVLGVQQANRAIEVNEMWHSRKKELEMENQHKGRQRDESKRVTDQSSGSTNRRHYADDASSSGLQSSSKRMPDTYYSGDEEGLKDEELEQFLHSRVKRGRGSVGSRIDETGPYLPRCTEAEDRFTSHDVRENRVILGPAKPYSSMLNESSESDEDESDKHRRKKEKVRSGSSEKRHSGKSKSKEKSRDKRKKEKSRDKKRKREEKRCKHYKKDKH